MNIQREIEWFQKYSTRPAKTGSEFAFNMAETANFLASIREGFDCFVTEDFGSFIEKEASAFSFVRPFRYSRFVMQNKYDLHYIEAENDALEDFIDFIREKNMDGIWAFGA